MHRTFITSLVLAGLVVFCGPAFASSLWLGNDTIGSVFQTNTTGGVITNIPSLPTTGIASNGTFLYFANPAGNFTKRTADGSTVLDSFSISDNNSGEDLAWDSKRSVLWRIVHTNVLQEIDPVTHSLVNSFSIPTADPILVTLGGLGVAYDNTRDELYVSFCHVGCASLAAGLVDVVNPVNGTVLSMLFRTDGFATGGLGYDPVTDSLWVGDLTTVRNMSRTGAVLSSFTRPQPAGFVDGLEFIGNTVPEPGALILVATGIGFLAVMVRRRRRSA